MIAALSHADIEDFKTLFFMILMSIFWVGSKIDKDDKP